LSLGEPAQVVQPEWPDPTTSDAHEEREGAKGIAHAVEHVVASAKHHPRLQDDGLVTVCRDKLSQMAFEVYKLLEPIHHPSSGGFEGKEAATKAIEEARGATPTRSRRRLSPPARR